MSLLMFDGFEAYSGSAAEFRAQMAQSGNWAAVGNAITATSTNARTGVRAPAVGTASTLSDYTWRTADILSGAEQIVGFGLQIISVGSTPRLLRFQDASGTTACGLRYTATGEFELMDAAGSTLHSFGASPADPTAGYVYVELKVTFSATTGAAELKVNGASQGTVASIDTKGAAADITRARFAQGTALYLDDVYFLNTSGDAPTDFLAPVRIHSLNPAADVETDWTPNSGTTHYTQVDDLPGGHDADSTYVASNTVGNRDLYDLTDLAAEYQNPVAVQAYWAARHDDSSGGAGMAALLKSGVTEVEGSEVALGSTYVLAAEPIQATDPDTGLAWTPAGVNALQIGVVVKSNL